MATRTPPPAMIAHYRSRPREVQAIDLGDGRHVVLEDPPRYVDSAAFNLAFEAIPEHRANGHRAPNGKPATRRQHARANGQGDNPKKIEARRLFEAEGKELPAIAATLKLKYPTLYGWKTAGKWKQGKKGNHAPPAAVDRGRDTGVLRQCPECSARTTWTKCPKGHTVIE